MLTNPYAHNDNPYESAGYADSGTVDDFPVLSTAVDESTPAHADMSPTDELMARMINKYVHGYTLTV